VPALDRREGNIVQPQLSHLIRGEAMKTYRFFTKSQHDVSAETLEEATVAFNEMKQKGLLPQFDSVIRIEVEDQEGHYVPVDHALRAGDLYAGKQAQLH
jgi:hypothetical protein